MGWFDPPGKEITKPDTHPNVSDPGTGGPSDPAPWRPPGIKIQFSNLEGESVG